MKKMTTAVLAATLASIVLTGAVTAPTGPLLPQGKKLDVVGHWVLDLKKSVNLPASFANVDSYTFNVGRSGDTLTVNAGLTGGGQTVEFPPFVYVLDGKETYRQDTLRGSERWSTGRWSKGGDAILVDTRISLAPPGRPAVSIMQHDVWKRVDEKTLEISTEQKYIGTDSVRTERRIYTKAK